MINRAFPVMVKRCLLNSLCPVSRPRISGDFFHATFQSPCRGDICYVFNEKLVERKPCPFEIQLAKYIGLSVIYAGVHKLSGQVARGNKFYSIAPNIWLYSVWNVFRATLLAPWILRRLQNLWKMCAPLNM